MTSSNAKRYVYVVVIVSSDHNAKAAVIAGPNEYKGKSLSRVLEQGWTPVRETPMGGNGDFCCSLVVLEGTTIVGDLPTESISAPIESAPKPAPAAAKKPAPAPAPAPKPAAAAAPAKKPAPAPAPVAMEDTDLGIELADEPPPASPAPKAGKEKEKEKETAKKASESDVSFDFLENLE